MMKLCLFVLLIGGSIACDLNESVAAFKKKTILNPHPKYT